ncbi:uncharacterized protein EI90DRAFT_3036255 [Cantharellus anzutake]|uniref:uncharacterized protein n=1 Tax=Cantharellus anzutake TaxID=1750568 RepID=UPI001908403B|nr:uncharacterized protein EI90DRAFT_3036255 [Cantharellus anzutake]KAF8340634.1 hypothetical protein EI90DRAFT_3036255 [Cantharellus anzutake]
MHSMFYFTSQVSRVIMKFLALRVSKFDVPDQSSFPSILGFLRSRSVRFKHFFPELLFFRELFSQDFPPNTCSWVIRHSNPYAFSNSCLGLAPSLAYLMHTSALASVFFLSLCDGFRALSGTQLSERAARARSTFACFLTRLEPLLRGSIGRGSIRTSGVGLAECGRTHCML